MKKFLKKMWKSERGVAAIEMALVTPFLLVLTFGSLEFGLLIYDKAMITNASREGARAAVAYNSDMQIDFCGDGTTVQTVVYNYLSDYLVSFGGHQYATISDVLTEASGTTPRTCTVTVNYNYNFLILPDLIAELFQGSMGNLLQLQAVTVMRMEQDLPDAAEAT